MSNGNLLEVIEQLSRIASEAISIITDEAKRAALQQALDEAVGEASAREVS